MFALQNVDELEEKERKEEYLLMEQIIKEEQNEDKQPKISQNQGVLKVGRVRKAPTLAKEQKAHLSTKITKKAEVEKAKKDFLPKGVKIVEDQRPNEKQYQEMEQAIDVKQFSLNFRSFLGKITKVTDGDTFKVTFRLDGKLTRFSFRLNGIDTPESRSGDVKEFGMYVKEVLRRMLEGKIVRVEAGQFDKYGRILGRIYAYSKNDEFCVNDFLIQNEMAKGYEGKTKVQFVVQDYQNFKKKYVRSDWPAVENYPRVFFKGGKN